MILVTDPGNEKNTSFVATQKKKLVATKNILSRQTYFCCDKYTFVASKDVYRDKSFVASKMILVAAPANDTVSPHQSKCNVTNTSVNINLTVVRTAQSTVNTAKLKQSVTEIFDNIYISLIYNPKSYFWTDSKRLIQQNVKQQLKNCITSMSKSLL